MLSLIRAPTSKISFWTKPVNPFFAPQMPKSTYKKNLKNRFFKGITLHPTLLTLILLLLSPVAFAQITEYTTPNYPNAYPNNSSNPPTQLSISGASSLSISVEGETEAKYDFIEILNSNQNSFDPPYKFDGSLNETFSVNGETIYVKFTSDYSVTRGGVKITITSNSLNSLKIEGTPTTSTKIDQLYSFTPTVSGSSSNLKFSVQNKPDWSTIDTTTGKLSGTPTKTGIFNKVIISVTDLDTGNTVSLPSFDVTVIDNTYQSPLTLEITTDNFPSETTWEITDISGNKKASGGPYSEKGKLYTETLYLSNGNYYFTIYDRYGDGICCGYGNGSYSLTDNNAQIIISRPETETFRFKFDKKEFNIETPVSPELSFSITLLEDSSATELARASNNLDSLGEWATAIFQSVTQQPTKGNISATAGNPFNTIKYQPKANESGTDEFTIQVKNSSGNTTTITVNVAITPVNDAPVITEGETKTVTMSEDGDSTAFSLTLNATDVDSDTITWSISQSATNGIASVEGTGTSKTINYVPNTDYFGSDNFFVQVSDGSLSDTIKITVNIDSVNDAPEFTSTPINTATQDQLYTYNITANDVESNNIQFPTTSPVLEKPAWLTLKDNGNGTATLSGTPLNKDVDSYLVKLQVTDDQGESSIQEFTITVENVNDKPQFDTTAPSTQEGMTEVYYYHVIKASDPDTKVVDEKITIELTAGTLPNGLKLTNIENSGTALLDGTPTQTGTFPLTFSVKDDDDLEASSKYSFTLDIEQFNRSPVINSVQQGISSLIINDKTVNITINEDNSLTLNFTASDLDGDALSWKVVSEAFGNITPLEQDNTTTYTLTYTTKEDFFGEESFSVQVTDNKATTAVTVNITINAENDVPVIKELSDSTMMDITVDGKTETALSVQEDQEISGVLLASDVDNSHDSLHHYLMNSDSICPPTEVVNTLSENTSFQGGTVNLTENTGFFTYKPASDSYHKTDDQTQYDSFSYKVSDGEVCSELATVYLKIAPVADTPFVTNAITTEGKQTTDGLIIARHSQDGDEVTHFKITDIQNGTLYQNDGTTPINNGDFITFAQGNDGLKFTPQSTPDSDAVNGTFKIQASLSADDNGLGGNKITATINTNLINDKPVLNTIGNQTLLLGNKLTFTASASDPDVPKQDLVFTLRTISDHLYPVGASIDPNGYFSWTPTTAGLFQVNVVVTDNGTNPAQLSDIKPVTIEVTQAPILTLPFTEKKVPINQKLTFTASAEHYENNLTFSLVDASSGAQITNSGYFTWTPTEAGIFPMTVKVTEPDGLFSTETVNIEVIDNTPPQIVPIADQIINLGQLLELNINATDTQNNAFTYQLLNAELLTGATIHPSTGKFTWLPIEQGNYTVTVETLEVDGLENTERLKSTMSFEVLVNDTPVVEPIEAKNVSTNELVTFTVSATHSQTENYPLQFSLVEGFPGATLDSKTGQFNWTPIQKGEYTGTIRVTETLGNLFTDMPIKIIVKALGTTLDLQLSSYTILTNSTNGTLNVYGRIHPDDSKTPVQDLEIELEIITPQELLTKTTKTLANGEYEFTDLPRFDTEGKYTFQTRFKGNDRLLASESEQLPLSVRDIVGYSLLVEGQNNDDKDTPTYNKTLNRVYFKMKQQGFKDEDIFYLNYDISQANQGIGVDDTPSKEKIQNSLATLQTRLNAAPAPLYLVMVDHGGADGSFYLDGEQVTITPAELDQWLETLEAGLNPAALEKPRIIVLGYCYAGAFINTLSKPGRTIITSAKANEVSYKGPKEPDDIRSGEFFIESFFHQLSLNHSLKTAFELATEETERQTLRGDLEAAEFNASQDGAAQHPLLDDNGDQQGSNELYSNSGDGIIAKEIYLGIQQESDLSNQPPNIVKVTDTRYLKADTFMANLFALVNNPGGRIKDNQVIVDIRPPSLKITPNAAEAQGSLEVDGLIRQFLPRSETQAGIEIQDGEEIFSASLFEVFNEPGKYEITYFVTDSQTQMTSAPTNSLVYKDRTGNNPPISFHLKSPANESEPETVLIFDWEMSADLDNDPLTYTLMIAKDREMNQIIYQNEELSIPMTYLDNSTPIDDLLNNGKTGLRDGTQYFWKVLAVDSYGALTHSETFSFTTNNTNAGPGLGSVYISSALGFSGVDQAQIQPQMTFDGLIPDIHQAGGISNMMLPPGRRRVTIKAEGFEEFTEEFDVASGLASTLEIKLTPIGGPQPGKIAFNAKQASVNEGDGTVDILVERIEDSFGEVSVNYQIVSGSAEEGNDYNATNISGKLTWTDQDNSVKQIPLTLIDDDQNEGTETLTITLSEPTGGATLDGVNPIIVLIEDNDEMSNAEEPTSADTSTSPLVTLEDTTEDTTEDPVSQTENSDNEDTTEDPVSQTENSDNKVDTGLDDQNISEDKINDLANAENLPTVQFMADRYITHEKIGPLSTFTVIRLGEPTGTLSVQYAVTENSTALLDQDYIGGSGTLTWNDGENTPKPITLTLLDDNEVEGPETIELVLQQSNDDLTLTTIAQATLIITDDETLLPDEGDTQTEPESETEVDTIIQFVDNHYTATEGDGTIEFPVERLGNRQGEVSAQYLVLSGTAIADLDYLDNRFGTLTWNEGDDEIKVISLTLIDDQEIENTENVHIVLLDQTSNAALAQMAELQLTILDNDQPQRLFLPSLGQGVVIPVGNNTRESVETRQALSLQIDTQPPAAFRGGASVNGLDYHSQLLMSPTQFVNIVGEIQIDSQHVGKIADILIVVAILSQSGDIEFFVMRDANGEIEIWDGEDMTQLVPALKNVTLGETQLVDIYQGLLGNGHLLVFFGYRLKESDLIVYNGEQPIEIQIENEALAQPHSVIWQADFTSDGERILTASDDGAIRLWDAQTGDRLALLKGHTQAITSMALNSSGTQLVTASDDGTAIVWDLDFQAKLTQFTGHTSTVESASFSPDDQQIVTASQDGTARIWEAGTGQMLKVLKGHEGGVNLATFNPDGTMIITASQDNTARLWEVETGETLAILKHNHVVEHAAFRPDGKLVVTASWDKTARVWEVESGEEIATLKHQNGVSYATFSPDGSLIATTSWDNTARLWVETRHALSLLLIGHQGIVNHASFSPDGQRLVTASSDGTAWLWDTETGNPLAVLKGHTNNVGYAAFSPDGERIVTASWDNTARVWEANTGELLMILKD